MTYLIFFFFFFFSDLHLLKESILSLEAEPCGTTKVIGGSGGGGGGGSVAKHSGGRNVHFATYSLQEATFCENIREFNAKVLPIT